MILTVKIRQLRRKMFLYLDLSLRADLSPTRRYKKTMGINWADASVIDREPDRHTRWIKEAIHIRKEGQRAINREEGSYQLSHAYDCFLGTFVTYCAKNWMKKWCFYSSDESFWWKSKSKRQGLRIVLVIIDEFCLRQYIRPNESICCGENWFIDFVCFEAGTFADMNVKLYYFC